MVERKSKPRTDRKKGDDSEPEGWDAVKQNPWFILVMFILAVAAIVTGVILLSEFLSGRSGNLSFEDAATLLAGFRLA